MPNFKIIIDPKIIYQRHKTTPIIGWGLILLKKMYSSKFIKEIRERRRVRKEALKILQELYGNSRIIKNYIQDFYRKKILKKEYSFGSSREFNILMLYVIIRMLKPEIVIETGVASGRSSAVILGALRDNNKGELYSIDLADFFGGENPDTFITKEGMTEYKGYVPKGKEPGWLIPDELRSRWHLILGDSKIKLPELLDNIKRVDIFYHDSDHNYETMFFEYKTVWPYISQGGFLFSDDVKWNNAFDDFLRDQDPKFHRKKFGFGILLK